MSGLKRARVRWLLALVLFCLLVVASSLLWPVKTTFPVLPNPNGYEALVLAASKLMGEAPDLGPTSQIELEKFVPANRNALTELKQGLVLTGAVTVLFSEAWMTGHSRELMDIKAAAIALDAEAAQLASTGDTNRALSVALDTLRWAEQAQRGGVLIDYLVGSACEMIAIRRMTNLLVGLDAEHLKLALRHLNDHESKRDSWAALMRRENEWSWRTYGLLRRIQMMVETRSLRPYAELRALMGDSAKEYRERVTRARMAGLTIATHVSELEQGQPPRSLSDLVPNYLPVFPTNLMSGEHLELPDPSK